MPTRDVAGQVQAAFRGALTVEDFVARWRAALGADGFDADDALLIVAVCRDELCEPFVVLLERDWGPAFHAGSLAGLLTLGRTGIGAAARHAPEEPGQPLRYVVVAAAHIGMDATGGFGSFRRSHQDVPSGTCGALMAFRGELVGSRLRLGFDPVDPEMSLLRERLLPALPYGEIPDPVVLTQLVAEVIDADLRELLGWFTSVAPGGHEVRTAVVTGILVHTEAGDWFQPQHPRIWSSHHPERAVDLGAAAR